MSYSRRLRITCVIGSFLALVLSAGIAAAQGVTTASVAGVVRDAQGGVVPGATVVAVHVPSGSTYESITKQDGRFFIPGMRVGGPYTVSAALPGFSTEERSNVTLNLGVAQDLEFTLKLAAVSETVEVVAESSPVFSSTRTGAATSVTRDELATLPTISGRINDITRMSPQAGSGGTFAGQDNRMNNITIDGSYFNNSFGLGGQPGDRTSVAPISLEAIEQVQVSVAPYDVRQGNFVGAGVNMVTRSGTNRLVGSIYTRYRNQSFVGTDAAGQAFNPGTFTTKNTGGFLGGPIVKNRLFAFGHFEKQEDTRPLINFRANQGGEPVTGGISRVLASDLTGLSQFLATSFKYDTGPFNDIDKKTPAKPFLVKTDYNLGRANKISFRYSQLSSSTDVNLSGSTSAGNGRGTNSSSFLNFQSSNYAILENIHSGIGEWNAFFGNSLSNSLIVGYTTNDESRAPIQLFPFVDILRDDTTYTSIGTDPFTPNNELRYHTFQAQDSFTKFSTNHSLTFGFSAEKYHSDNVFFQLSNSVYTYGSLADFYTDANGYLANPNRTTSPVTLRRFQLGYMNIPNLDKPLQQLDAWYLGGYVQDQWQVRSNVTLTAGIRIDTPIFKDTGFANPAADALTFRDETGAGVKYSSGELPAPKPLWSPRVGFNWDINEDQRTQVRGGTGVFTGKPAYVWLSNQIGNTGLLLGRIDETTTTGRPFNPNPQAYRPSVTGAPAASYELDVTDPDFKFPQTWRSNIAVDRALPGGLVATAEYLYNHDLNGIYYINANLPAAQSAFTGVDTRPRWVGTPCAGAGNRGGCVTRVNSEPGNIVTAAYIIKNQDVGRSWIASGSLMKSLSHGFSAKGAYSYGRSRNTVDAGSTAATNWGTIASSADPNNPGLGYSQNSPGHRVWWNASYSRQYFGFGTTTVSAYWEARTNSVNFANNASYVFAGDMNSDGVSNNDLIYIPRDTSDMSFSEFVAAGHTFTIAEQQAAFDAYIKQDPYLSKHRGQYAERNALFLPIVKRMDLSLSQDIFHSLSGHRHSGQIRLDITNFGNLINNKWGVGQRPLVPSTSSSLNLIPILTTPTVDATGKVLYRMALTNNALPTTTFQTTAFATDVYTMMLSFRYNFN